MSEEMKKKVIDLANKLNSVDEKGQIAVTAFADGLSIGRELAKAEKEKKNGQN